MLLALSFASHGALMRAPPAAAAALSSSRRIIRMISESPRTVLVPIADDSEEIETACITDTLVRAGAAVTVASVMDGRLQCKMSRGLKVVADTSIAECVGKEWDAIALPGGMPGAEVRSSFSPSLLLFFSSSLLLSFSPSLLLFFSSSLLFFFSIIFYFF